SHALNAPWIWSYGTYLVIWYGAFGSAAGNRESGWFMLCPPSQRGSMYVVFGCGSVEYGASSFGAVVYPSAEVSVAVHCRASLTSLPGWPFAVTIPSLRRSRTCWP